MDDGPTHFLSALADRYFMLAFYSERLASPLLAIAVISHWLPHLIYYKDSQYPIEIARRACAPFTTKIDRTVPCCELSLSQCSSIAGEP